jgi:hypothetical protein
MQWGTEDLTYYESWRNMWMLLSAMFSYISNFHANNITRLKLKMLTFRNDKPGDSIHLGCNIQVSR